MAPGKFRLVLVIGSLIVVSLGCAHRGPDPFLFGPPSLAAANGSQRTGSTLQVRTSA